MKYLFISGTDFEHRKLTGAHKRFIELVTALSKENDVSLIAYPYSGFEGYDINYYPITNTMGKKLPNHLSEQLTMTKLLKKYRSSIHYDYAIAFGQTMANCYRKAKYNNVVTLFREDLIGYQKAVGASRLKIGYFWLQERKAVKYSTKIIVQCNHDKIALIKRHKDIDKKIYVQGNNINVSWTENVDVANLSNDIPKVLFIGNFSSPRKGHQFLLPAVSKLLDEGIDFELIVLGEGKELSKYKEVYGKYEKIKFIGHTKDITLYLSQSDIDIVPSLIDSCPNTVLEGLNAGLAVYGSKTGGIPDLLIDKKYMFSPNENDIYIFLKDIITTRRYLNDAIDQKYLIKLHTFDWPEKIKRIIND